MISVSHYCYRLNMEKSSVSLRWSILLDGQIAPPGICGCTEQGSSPYQQVVCWTMIFVQTVHCSFNKLCYQIYFQEILQTVKLRYQTLELLESRVVFKWVRAQLYLCRAAILDLFFFCLFLCCITIAEYKVQPEVDYYLKIISEQSLREINPKLCHFKYFSFSWKETKTLSHCVS